MITQNQIVEMISTTVTVNMNYLDNPGLVNAIKQNAAESVLRRQGLSVKPEDAKMTVRPHDFGYPHADVILSWEIVLMGDE